MQEDILGITAWWLGLTDQGHEGRWVWQHSVEDTSYTNWAPNYPGSSNAEDDCAVMTSRDSFMWSDTDCGGRRIIDNVLFGQLTDRTAF